MSKIMYKGRSYANAGVSSDATSIPTADMTAAFDSNAHMNSEDMTAAEVSNFVDGLDGQGANLADYVVEQGISGIWTYRKWNSGIAECWGKRTSTADSSGNTTVSQSLPSFFINETPIVSVFGTQPSNTGSYMAGMSVGGSSGSYAVAFSYPGWASGTSTNYIRAIGRWK